MSIDNNFTITNYDEAVTIIKENSNINFWNVIGEPGTGKSTTFLFYLISRGYKVFCTMPTKMSVYSASEYLRSDNFITSREDLKESIGTAVDSIKSYNNVLLSQIMEFFGYSNSDDFIDTKLVYCTNGHFRKVMKNIFLYLKSNTASRMDFCDFIVLDEYHMNTQDQFMIMMYWSILKTYFKKVPKLILMSATGEISKNTITYTGFSQKIKRQISYLDDFKDEDIFNLDDSYIEKITKSPDSVVKYMPDIISNMCTFIYSVYKSKNLKPKATILVFLPGISTMNKIQDKLELYLTRNDKVKSFEIFKAHSSMSNTYLKEILKEQKTQFKIVLSTTICETSLTIKGVNVVISSMYKRDLFEGDEGTTILKTVKISKKSAIQQAGRTGRDMSGIVLRLVKNEKVFNKTFIEDDIKQMDRLPILKEVLEVQSTNLDSGLFFNSLKDTYKISRANAELLRLKCLVFDEVYKITECGDVVSMIPLSIRSSIIIYNGFVRAKNDKNRTYNIYPDIVMAVALDFYQSIFVDQTSKKSSYPLLPILYPYVKLHSLYQKIKPHKNKILSFCKEENLVYDSFLESISRMNEIYNYVDFLNEKVGFEINKELSMFTPALMLKRLLKYSNEIFPLMTHVEKNIFVNERTKYILDSKFVLDNYDTLNHQEELEFYSLSSYRRPDSRKNDPLFSKIYIPTTYRDMTRREENEFFNYLEDEEQEDEEQEEEENPDNTEEQDEFDNMEKLLMLDVH